ncbi:MAG: hypothetical protein QG632_69 [Candidatus Dependentiae bacterium]|nr:hypothetical protein [Candidatus Dependentiae bacterium]
MFTLKPLFFLTLLAIAVNAATPPTSKTFYKSPNAPLWLSISSLPFNQRKKPTNHSLQSAVGIEGFYWKSTAKKTLGNYFGFYDTISGNICPFLSVTADLTKPHSLTPQNIIHNSENANNWSNPVATPLQATINFSPYIEQYGVIFTNSVCIDKWITVHTIMPWMQKNHVMGLATTNNTSETVNGTLYNVMDFFTGALKQEAGNSPDQQDALQYGKLANKQSIHGLADITLLCLLTPNVSDEVSVHVGLLAVLPTTSRSHGVYLFEPTLGSAGHPLFGLHGRASTDFFSLNAITVGGSADATIRASVSTQEVRSPSFLLDTSDVAFARYALGGKQNARRLFPLINLLTQVVSVTPGTSIELNVGLNVQYKALTSNVEYRFSRASEEKVSGLSSWPAGVYALSKLSYSQIAGSSYDIFDLANDSAFGSNSSLTSDMLYFDAAATPTQMTHTFSFSARCVPLPKFSHSTLQLRGYYSFTGAQTFGVGGYGFSCSLCHIF